MYSPGMIPRPFFASYVFQFRWPALFLGQLFEGLYVCTYKVEREDELKESNGRGLTSSDCISERQRTNE